MTFKIRALEFNMFIRISTNLKKKKRKEWILKKEFRAAGHNNNDNEIISIYTI